MITNDNRKQQCGIASKGMKQTGRKKENRMLAFWENAK
jgi:hypothetical protein